MTSQQSADIELTKYRLDRIAFKRIAEIDAMFDMGVPPDKQTSARYLATERCELVNGINARGGKIAHRHVTTAKMD